jgi:Ca2+-binding RTX toxin-like protein
MVTLIKHDLEFILKQIIIAEQHAAGVPLDQLVDSPLLPYGLRTVDGSFNNFLPGRTQFGAAGEPFLQLTTADFRQGSGTMPAAYNAATNGNNNDYSLPGSVVDAEPRLISNLIVDQTLHNPAAIAAALRPLGLEGQDLLDAINGVHQAFKALKAAEANAGATPPEVLALQSEIAAIQAQIDAAIGTPFEAVIPFLQDLLIVREAQLSQAMIDFGDPQAAIDAAQAALDDLLEDYGIEMDGPSVMIPNVSPDEGLSASYNSIFTIFGQFFDHGLDLVAKGGNGTVYIPLSPDDPLYNPDTPHQNFMVMTRVTTGEDADNAVTPWVDQNQTYTSHASHQVFLREYKMVDGKPVATGHLLESPAGGLATWGDVKSQAAQKLGILLTDKDVFDVPVLATDAYGKFIPGPNGFAQLMVGVDADGMAIFKEGNPADPLDPSVEGAARTRIAFLDDIAHKAVPKTDASGNLLPDDDDAVGYAGGFDMMGRPLQYDDEMLDAHFITGDGRGNENIALSAIHYIFHAEHNRIVEHTKDVVLATLDLDFLNAWLLEPVASWPADASALLWNGERLFQTGRFATEMQYQHLVFEEFARSIQPDIDVFMVQPNPEIDPAIFAEFAHVVYRFGHSMLNETVLRINADGTRDDLTLFDAFLNPIQFSENGMSQAQAAGAIFRGMTSQVGNEIDEFVTNVLRNELVGLPLDLAAINIARGRDTGMPTLNEARAQFYDLTDADIRLKPYESWSDFALNLHNPASIVNFIAAYGNHATITAETTIEGKRDAAMALVFGGDGAPADRLAFLNGPAAETGVNAIDFWVGGLAEKKMPFGGMLGSTFAFVFELQLENLQDGDRFYYLSRVQGLNLLSELENNSLAKIIMRNTDLGETGFALPDVVFFASDHSFYVDYDKQLMLTGQEDPEHSDPFLGAVSQLVVRKSAAENDGVNYFRYNGLDHVVIAGTEGADHIIGGGGDDMIWGFGGNDRIETGDGVDHVDGGDGDDIIINSGTPIGDVSTLKGGNGNDVIHGGTGMALIFGGAGNDFLMAGKDGGELFGGLGNDFLLGGDGSDILFGGEGDDWIEGGGRFDFIAGDTAELFFNSTIIGHDVLNGGGGDTDYDADSGDDIMFAGEGIQKFIGMWGHDWVISKGMATGYVADMNVEVFTTLPLEVLRDRFSQVEAVSGWIHDDIIRGDDRSNAPNPLLPDQIPDPTPEGNFIHNELDLAGIARIGGLGQIVTHDLMRMAEYWADGSGDMKLVFDAGNILLGGGGSDIIEGRGGDDIIDGDAWLNVRVAIMANHDGTGAELGSVDSLRDNLTLNGVTKPLTVWMLEGAINPGQLKIIREIKWDDSGVDTAVYWDVRANYDVIHNSNGSVTVHHRTQTPGAVNPETGQNRVSDGTDRLYNIELLQFGDMTIDLRPQAASPATGAPVISSLHPTQGVPLTVDISSIADENGIASAIAIRWQMQVGGVWMDIPGATGSNFTPAANHVNTPLRVVATFTDGTGNPEMVVSTPTAVVGLTFTGGSGADLVFGTQGADIINGAGGADEIHGLGGNDRLFGGAGADVIYGGDGDDWIEGGAGADILHGDAGNDIIFGGDGSDTIFGGSGDDIIHGGGANVTNRIDAGSGDDRIIWTAVNTTNANPRDIVDGGSGTDTFEVNGLPEIAESFTIYTRAAYVALGGLRDLQIEAGTEIVITRNGNANANVIAELRNIEEIILNGGATGSGGGDNGGDSYAFVGDFTQTSLSPNTIRIFGSTGNDRIDLSGLLSAHRIIFQSMGGNDVLLGAMRPQDLILLPDGADPASYQMVQNADGTLTLTGDAGSITFLGTATQVWIDEESGPAFADLATTPATPDSPVAPAPAAPADSGGMVFVGGDTNDSFVGGAGNDVAMGGAGDDALFGGAGNDALFGDAGNDRIFGGDGDDYLVGGAGDDLIFGGAGNDWFVAEVGDGNDSYHGDEGIDTLDMSAITADIVADLGSGLGGRGTVSSLQTGNDTIWSVENFIGGSGKDLIIASRAVNVLDGGGGDDIFRFLSAADADGDMILGFTPGDRIDLSHMDADASLAGKQSFTIVSGGFTGKGQLMISEEFRDGESFTLVSGNISDSDGADFTITLKGSHQLTEDQFIL